ncbi:hypothetical protein, partial [Tessaracoccus sp. OH4464_COT-324]|uniref:hypothetical protein n=1 Tax=Tessaracoccus sp. OH4464_COT-324 TaxID=2491059 RepID=UPI000FA8EF29
MRQDLPRDVIDHAAVDFLPPLYDSDVAGRIQAALDDACLEVNPSVAALARTGSGYRISDYLLDRDELPTTTTDSLWEAA